MGTPVEMLRRVAVLARAHRLSAHRIGALAGHPDCVRNLKRIAKNGGRGWTDDVVSAVARVLKCAPAWLRGEPGAPEPDIPADDMADRLAEKAKLQSKAREIAQRLHAIDEEILSARQDDRPARPRRRVKMR